MKIRRMLDSEAGKIDIMLPRMQKQWNSQGCKNNGQRLDKCKKNHAKYKQSLWVKSMAKKSKPKKYSNEGMTVDVVGRVAVLGGHHAQCVGKVSFMPIGTLVTARLNAAAEKNKKARAANARKRETARKITKTPMMVVTRDQRILQREISKWTRTKKTAMLQVSHLKEVFEKAKLAQRYLMSAPASLITELSYGQNWSGHPELAYIYDMRELF